MKQRIRAVTVIQPWAQLIVDGFKPVENRTWWPRGLAVGDYLAIHAGARVDLECWHGADDTAPVAFPRHPSLDAYDAALLGTETDRALREALTRAAPYGAVVGVAVLDEVRTEPRGDDPWWCGPVGWYLRDAVAIDPVPCKGAQGLWTLPDDVLVMVRERWDAARKAAA